MRRMMMRRRRRRGIRKGSSLLLLSYCALPDANSESEYARRQCFLARPFNVPMFPQNRVLDRASTCQYSGELLSPCHAFSLATKTKLQHLHKCSTHRMVLVHAHPLPLWQGSVSGGSGVLTVMFTERSCGPFPMHFSEVHLWCDSRCDVAAQSPGYVEVVGSG